MSPVRYEHTLSHRPEFLLRINRIDRVANVFGINSKFGSHLVFDKTCGILIR